MPFSPLWPAETVIRQCKAWARALKGSYKSISSQPYFSSNSSPIIDDFAACVESKELNFCTYSLNGQHYRKLGIQQIRPVKPARPTKVRHTKKHPLHRHLPGPCQTECTVSDANSNQAANQLDRSTSTSQKSTLPSPSPFDVNGLVNGVRRAIDAGAAVTGHSLQ